jgi:peptidoglycan/xylan/chitin deacetylase (PgdA/CDA1 family)
VFLDKSIVPVLMFHSVGLNNSDWIYSHLSEPVGLFKDKMLLLKHKKFNFIFWNELHDHMNNTHKLPDNSLMLTFDDGYLDNWVYVFPYLKKYRIKATIFVNPDFVDPGIVKRLNLEDVWQGKCTLKELDATGFLNWSEMKEMESSDLVDIQSHAQTHTWYFSGHDIVDYHKPSKTPPYPWLLWNQRPERKPHYMKENQQLFVEYGHPIFQYGKSLITRRYFPSEQLVTCLIEFVKDNGEESFFTINNWQEKIDNYAAKLHDRYKGRYETDAEYHSRVRCELYNSKKIIETNLDKQVDFICWPGGGNNETTRQIAKKLGYKAWTLSSRDLSDFRNRPGANPYNVKRIGTSNKISIKGYGKGMAGPYFQLLTINAHRNSLLYKYLKRCYQAAFVFRKGK